jgi:hypothetical protein
MCANANDRIRANGKSCDEHLRRRKEAGFDLIVYSKKMRAFLEEGRVKGYVVNRGKISFLVYWKNKDNGREILIALAEIELKREYV